MSEREPGPQRRAFLAAGAVAVCAAAYFLSSGPALRWSHQALYASSPSPWVTVDESNHRTWRRAYAPIVWATRRTALRKPLYAWFSLWVSRDTVEVAVEPGPWGGSIASFEVRFSCSLGMEELIDDDGTPLTPVDDDQPFLPGISADPESE